MKFFIHKIGALVCSICLLTSCAVTVNLSDKDEVDSYDGTMYPGEIEYNGKTFIYNHESPIELSDYDLKNNNARISDVGVPDGWHTLYIGTDLSLLLNEDNEIRYIGINSKDVDTYKGIRIGDSSSKIKKLYKYEQNEDSLFYRVLFQDGTEIKSVRGKNPDGALSICYSVEDDIIKDITILDNMLGDETLQ